MTVEVTDPGIFDAIEKGEITGFSMGGSGVYATEDDDISGEGNSVQKSGLNIFQKMAKAFTTPKPVKKGAVMDGSEPERCKSASERRGCSNYH